MKCRRTGRVMSRSSVLSQPANSATLNRGGSKKESEFRCGGKHAYLRCSACSAVSLAPGLGTAEKYGSARGQECTDMPGRCWSLTCHVVIQIRMSLTSQALKADEHVLLYVAMNEHSISYPLLRYCISHSANQEKIRLFHLITTNHVQKE